jgi:hypothetical protein
MYKVNIGYLKHLIKELEKSKICIENDDKDGSYDIHDELINDLKCNFNLNDDEKESLSGND